FETLQLLIVGQVGCEALVVFRLIETGVVPNWIGWRPKQQGASSTPAQLSHKILSVLDVRRRRPTVGTNETICTRVCRSASNEITQPSHRCSLFTRSKENAPIWS